MFDIKLKENIKRVRLDVGTSSTAPNSAFWLSKYNDMAVFAFEPNPFNAECVRNGTDVYPNDYKLVQNKGIVTKDNTVIATFDENRNQFEIFEVAVDNVDTPIKKTFYCTSQLNTGCSSLHKPIDALLNGVVTEKEVEVTAISLKSFFEKFDWEKIPFIEYLKTDTQSNDLNVIKSCGEYLKKICFVQSEYYAHSAYEGELSQLESFNNFNQYMLQNGFKCYFSSGTDAAYVNEELIPYIIQNGFVNDSLEFTKGHNYLN
jgi:FkbM family methyltransferase